MPEDRPDKADPANASPEKVGLEKAVPANAGPKNADAARRLAEIFGDVLPESTGDDRDLPTAAGDDSERWYTENRPPHHDAR